MDTDAYVKSLAEYHRTGQNLQSAVRIISSNTIHKSWHTHDYITFTSLNGEYMLDGGNDYIRTNLHDDDDDIEWLILTDYDDLETIADKYVPKAGEDGVHVFAKHMDEKELTAVVERMKHPLVKQAMLMLLQRKSSLLDSIVDPT